MAGRLFKKADRPSVAIQRAALMQGMHLYYVKYYGKEEVPEAKGEKVVDYALHRILSDRRERKREGIKSARVELSVSLTGIKVTDRSTGHIFLDIPLQNVSYCQDDRRGNNNIFCFIAKEHAKAPKCCYAFKSAGQAGEIMNTIGHCFSQARQQSPMSPSSSSSSPARQASVSRGPTAARPANTAQSTKVTRLRAQPAPSFRNPPPAAATMSASSSSSSAATSGTATRELEREMRDMEKTFEDDFKFAMARASVRTKPADTKAFGAQSPSPSAQLPAVHAGAFHEQTKIKPSASGFDDSFVEGKPATPAAPKHNPYARKRGEAPPAKLAGQSQIQVPDEFKHMRPKKRQQQQQQKASSGLGDDDFFAEIAATRAKPAPHDEQQQQQQKHQGDVDGGADAEEEQHVAHVLGSGVSPTASTETPFGFDDFDPRATAEETPVVTTTAAMHDDGVTIPRHDDDDDDDDDQSPDEESDVEVDNLLAQLTSDLHADEYSDDDNDDDAGAPVAVSDQEHNEDEEEGEDAHAPHNEEREEEEVAVSGDDDDEAATAAAQDEVETAGNEEEEEEGGENGHVDVGGDEDTDVPPEEMPLVQLCQHVWSLTTPDDDDCVDGGQMRTFMTMSQLPNNTLGLIWSMVDTEQRGKLDYRQLGFALGLMGQAQRGEELDPSVIGPATPPPTLHGLPPPADEDDSTA